MANTKTYRIVVNGVQESINAVDALNKSLKDLEERIKVLENKNLKLTGTGTGGKTDAKASKQLQEQSKLEKQILETEKKLEEVRDKNYQQLLHMKEELREYTQIAKSAAAAEENRQGLYDPNTMLGMKGQLRSIKQEMQTLDVNSDRFKELIAQANTLNSKLKEIESGYGQYGRNVGNYANGVADGMNKIKVAVGDTTREYDNYRQAVKALREERFSLSQTLGQESEQYKQIDRALKTLESDYKDLNMSSRFMDNMLDTMQSFTALAAVGQGLSMLFGIDDQDFQKAMQKFAAFSMILQGVEVIMKQIQSKQGLLAKGWNKMSTEIDKVTEKLQLFIAKYEALNFNKKYGTSSREWLGIDADDILKIVNGSPERRQRMKEEALKGWTKDYQAMGKSAEEAATLAQKKMDSLLKSMNRVTKAAKLLKFALGAIGVGLMFFLPDIIEGISNMAKNLNSSKVAAEQAEMALNTLNRALKTQMDLISSSYLKGWISDERFLTDVYKAQTDAIVKQIDALQERARTLKETFNLSSFDNFKKYFTSTQNIEFRGQKFNGETTVGAGRVLPMLFTGFFNNNDLERTVKSIGEVEAEWRKCNQAISEGKDYFDKWGSGFKDWFKSLYTTMKDTEEVMRGMGNIKLSDTVADFQRVSDQFNKGKISAEQYQKELARLRNEMNNNQILQSVIANLDKYIPDEKVRTAVQNIINEIYRLDDAFNMTSPEQIHYWNQVRIDAMKDGYAKAKAQIDENERYEIQQRAHTEEQVTLLHNKYARQRQEAQERYNKKNVKSTKDTGKKLRDVENELIALRIENMKNGMEKALAQIENERRLALQKAKENGIKVGEMTLEINKKYDQKILEEKRKWAFDMMKTYEDLEARIQQINRATFETEVTTATQKVRSREKNNTYDTGYSFITPSTFDDTKKLEEYYRNVLKIQEETADKEQTIRQDSLDRILEYDQKEEELRHKRLIDLNNGEYIQQLRAGLITQEEYDELIEKEGYAHTARMNALQRKYEAESSASTEEHLESIYSMYDTYWGNIINNVRKDYDDISEILDKQPVRDKGGWGIVNIGATSTAYNKALDMYDNLKNNIIKKQMELARALNEHRISPEDFAIRQGELKAEIKAIDESVENVKLRQRELVGEFMQSIQQYIQAGLQAVSDLMRSIWEYQDAQYEYEMNQLEKQIDEYAELLDKQKEITEQHKDAIDDIEDELATSRGDRRQHLIDQLNEEIAAQRRSMIEQKRIEREEEKLKKKKEREEEAQRKREHQRQVQQAFISWHLSIANGLATQPFMPVGLAMGALATALGAVQYALVKSQKYAEGGQLSGGLIQGKSHSQGGVKVLGGRAEVEGGEFITNKRTTAQNLDLLEYINSKKKKVDISDLIQFYNGGKVRNNITKNVRTKFADGGVVPSLRTDIDINDRLLTAIEDYAERDVVVSVVDINRRQQAVKNVQVLAGLND